jgi:hypothetical protein
VPRTTTASHGSVQRSPRTRITSPGTSSVDGTSSPAPVRAASSVLSLRSRAELRAELLPPAPRAAADGAAAARRTTRTSVT